MSIDSTKLHVGSTLKFSFIQKHAHKYVKSITSCTRSSTKYLKVIRQAKVTQNTCQLSGNPFSNPSLIECTQTSRFLKKYLKYIRMHSSVENITKIFRFRSLFTSLIVPIQTIDISEPENLIHFLPSRSCQVLKMIYNSPVEPIPGHIIRKIIKKEPESQIPAALQVKDRSSFRRLSFEDVGNDQSRLNVNRPAVHTNRISLTILQSKFENNDIFHEDDRLSRFFSRCEKSTVLKKLVINFEITKESLKFLVKLNQWLGKQKSLEIDLCLQDLKIISQAEKNQLDSLGEIWKKVSSLCLTFNQDHTYLLNLVKLTNRNSRNLKKLQINVTELSELIENESPKDLVSFLSNSTELILSVYQLTFKEILTLFSSFYLPKMLQKLTVSILEAPEILRTRIISALEIHNQENTYVRLLIDQLKKVYHGDLEVILTGKSHRSLQFFSPSKANLNFSSRISKSFENY